ncbi:3-phosphoglycerate dehydrogenase [Acidihalobacter yilgarnensis]|uniref:3-phosphoglycerate dehydrogenase n=1 Tax=Acidihalobacter yilgarnensis TaxID=2819280 RepID=A0A1D8INN5_9GAMM|nr:hydroxyacid dehydrogenase [Acidihalobacter yilgarnensis]AOU98034.1 3-phosphoglycerate dehydrogenase [Acidihalobacter yilgarnensis]
MSDVVISEFMDGDAVEALRARLKVRYEPDLADHPIRLADYLHAARALIVRNRTRVDAKLLATAPRLRVVGRLGVGLDNIDLDYCRHRGIRVLPAIGANNIAVAEYVIATMLILVRGSFGATGAMLTGQWPRAALVGGEVQGRELGLVGFGGIARAVACRARGLGLVVRAFDPGLNAADSVWAQHAVEPVDSLASLLAGCDVLSLHVPLNADSRHLMGTQELALMRPGSILINTARGGVVDDAALSAALREGRLAGAALDVFETEPLSAHSMFHDLENLILTPHIAGVTRESNARVSRMIGEAVVQTLEEGPA